MQLDFDINARLNYFIFRLKQSNTCRYKEQEAYASLLSNSLEELKESFIEFCKIMRDTYVLFFLLL